MFFPGGPGGGPPPLPGPMGGPPMGYPPHQMPLRDPDEEYDPDDCDFDLFHGQVVMDRFQIIKLLGCGMSAKIVLCVDLTNGQQVALKISKPGPDNYEEVSNEVRILNMLEGADPAKMQPWLGLLFAQVIASPMGEPQWCLVFPLMGPSVYHVMKKRGGVPFSLSEAAVIIHQVLQALSFFHHHVRLIHGDVKPENILTDPILGINKVKIIDVGGSVLDFEPKQEVGTVHYNSPELLAQAPYSFQTDMFSTGLVLLELLTGRTVIEATDNDTALHMLQALLGPLPMELMRPMPPPGFPGMFGGPQPMFPPPLRMQIASIYDMVPPHERDVEHATSQLELIDMLERLLAYNPRERPNAQSMLSHPWITRHIDSRSHSNSNSRKSSTNDQLSASGGSHLVGRIPARSPSVGPTATQTPPPHLPLGPNARSSGAAAGTTTATAAAASSSTGTHTPGKQATASPAMGSSNTVKRETIGGTASPSTSGLPPYRSTLTPTQSASTPGTGSPATRPSFQQQQQQQPYQTPSRSSLIPQVQSQSQTPQQQSQSQSQSQTQTPQQQQSQSQMQTPQQQQGTQTQLSGARQTPTPQLSYSQSQGVQTTPSQLFQPQKQQQQEQQQQQQQQQKQQQKQQGPPPAYPTSSSSSSSSFSRTPQQVTPVASQQQQQQTPQQQQQQQQQQIPSPQLSAQPSQAQLASQTSSQSTSLPSPSAAANPFPGARQDALSVRESLNYYKNLNDKLQQQQQQTQQMLQKMKSSSSLPASPSLGLADREIRPRKGGSPGMKAETPTVPLDPSRRALLMNEELPKEPSSSNGGAMVIETKSDTGSRSPLFKNLNQVHMPGYMQGGGETLIRDQSKESRAPRIEWESASSENFVGLVKSLQDQLGHLAQLKEQIDPAPQQPDLDP